ncbi:MAG TPA: hypothetical protein P5210_05870, partial [Draconibacterium sp.]|nr:hypothetical protein [Draconibacterium sp.]
MKSNLKIYLLIVLGFVFVDAFAQNNIKRKMPVLFTDRDFCVSGDTVWVKVFQPEELENLGNIIHVQLDGKNNHLISSIAIKTVNNTARGFISIPDSLSTGQYFISAFFNAQRNIAVMETSVKSLFVFNRFEDRVEEIELKTPNSREKDIINNSAININTDKNEYLTRENVALNIDINSGYKIKNAIVRATLVDPLTQETEIENKFRLQSSNSDIPDFTENDGILLNGKVTGKNGELTANALVLLTIGGEQPYLDYYVLNENGDFHFYIKNAFGNGNVFLQVVSNSDGQFIIQLENNFMVRAETNQFYLKTLNIKQTDFINTSINASLTNKIFNPELDTQKAKFEMPQR